MESHSKYVAQTPNSGWRLVGTRVSLDSVVHAYWQGRMPEAMAADFPTLTLEQIHGAIAFYLGHRKLVDGYLADQDSRWQQFQAESAERHSPLIQRIRGAALESGT